MNRKSVAFITMALIAVVISGCSRTVEDVAKWEANHNTKKLEEALTDPKFEVRQAAAESLGNLKTTEAVDDLAACLNDEEESVKVAAINALVNIGGPATVTPLIAALRQDNAETRTVAANALGNLKASAAVDPLAEMLSDTNETVQLAACKALGRIGNEAACTPLAEQLTIPSNPASIRLACINALTETGRPVAFKALVNTLADEDKQIREAATTALAEVGQPAVPSVIDGLKSKNANVRQAAMAMLKQLDAVPTEGDSLVWYLLARSSLKNNPEYQAAVVKALANKGMPIAPALMDAASIDIPGIREPAALALERIGEPCLDAVMEKLRGSVNKNAKDWFNKRSQWVGAPAASLDLWGAISALDPTFPTPQPAKTVLSASDAPRIRANIPALVSMLNDKQTRTDAIKQLTKAGPKANLPLIAALGSTNAAVVDAAATLLVNRADERACQPLMTVLQRRLDAGKPLSRSSLYAALLELENPEAEPLLLKVRPSTTRAFDVFNRHFSSASAIAADTKDLYTDNEAPISFNIGYLKNGQPGHLEFTFAKDEDGNWVPSPALPASLP